MPYDIYPAVDENIDFAQIVRQRLAISLELRNTVIPMTEVTRNNLITSEKWDGRLIVNTDTDHIERYDATDLQWHAVANLSDIQDSLSQAEADALYVNSTGNETIDGVKTFSNSPIVPAATTPTQVPNYGQLTHTHAGTYWGKWVGTQTQYNAIPSKDPNVLYCITG